MSPQKEWEMHCDSVKSAVLLLGRNNKTGAGIRDEPLGQQTRGLQLITHFCSKKMNSFKQICDLTVQLPRSTPGLISSYCRLFLSNLPGTMCFCPIPAFQNLPPSLADYQIVQASAFIETHPSSALTHLSPSYPNPMIILAHWIVSGCEFWFINNSNSLCILILFNWVISLHIGSRLGHGHPWRGGVIILPISAIHGSKSLLMLINLILTAPTQVGNVVLGIEPWLAVYKANT